MPELSYHTPLEPDDLRRLGVPAPWGFGLADQVRFGELDALGHVNHTAYLRWYESFRLPYLRARGVTDYGPTAPRLVLKQVTCTYLQEMGLGLDYIVTGRARAMRRTSFTMEFGVWVPAEDAEAVCAATGETLVVLLNRANDGRYPIPDAARAALAELDGTIAE